MNDSLKIKVLYAIVAILVIFNAGVIGFIVTRHPHGGPRDGHGPGGLVIKELKFNEAQQKQFEQLRDEHHGAMVRIGEQERMLHDQLFSTLSGSDTSKVDSLLSEISKGQRERDIITYHHLGQVRQMCDPAQQKIFDGMIAKAMAQAHREEGPPPPRD